MTNDITRKLRNTAIGISALVVGTGVAYGAPQKDGVKFTAPNYFGAKTEYVSKGEKWGYDPNPKDNKVEWKKSDNQTRVNGQYDQYLFSNAAKQSNAGKTKGPKKSPEEIARELAPPKKSPADIAKEACEKEPKLCPNKTKTVKDKKTGASITGVPADEKEETSYFNWSAYVGGNSEGRGFGELRFGTAKPKENGTVFDFYLRGYSQGPVESESSTKTKLIDEALVGPGIYRIRTDTETTINDVEEGQIESGIIWGYQISPGLTVFARAGILPTTVTEYRTLKSTVSFEDSEGKPIGESQTARQNLKPKD